jgi:poly-gamma-glutamate synthase PgsB/CapB
MSGVELLVTVTALLILLFCIELWVHNKNLAKIPIRVHVNGTRGKSSVTRLIAAALREAGIVTCAKTTGTLARFILPDGREVPIFRPAGPNVIEQRRMVATATAYGAQALVIECMALSPELQALSELKLIRATHGVITNARPDHLEVMGPDAAHVAAALAGMTPIGGKLYTTEVAQLEVLKRAARDRKTELCAIGPDEIAAIGADELEPFSYTEHPDNVALALRITSDLGVDREVALEGMWKAPRDPGALTECDLDFFGRRMVFVNAFAANDPVTSEQLWNLARERHPELARKIALFNCRVDRPDRSIQLGSELPRWSPADYVMLMGTGTYLFARAAVKAGLDSTKLILVEDLRDDEIFERIVSLVESSALVMGMGNIGGLGFSLTRYFANRSRPKDSAA